MTRVVTFGEIMLRLSPPGNLRFTQARSFDAIYGGGESNVAFSLAYFGIPAEFVTRLPPHEIGDSCMQFLRQHGVGTRHIVRGGERLGIYFLEHGAVHRGSKDVAAGNYDGITENVAKVLAWIKEARGGNSPIM